MVDNVDQSGAAVSAPLLVVADFKDLISRLEAAEFGSWELDDAVLDAVGLVEHPHKQPNGDWSREALLRAGFKAANLTQSIDASKSLLEEKLPDFWWLVRTDETFGSYGNCGPIGPSPNSGGPCWSALAKTAPLALCASLLKALEAKVGSHDEPSRADQETQRLNKKVSP